MKKTSIRDSQTCMKKFKKELRALMKKYGVKVGAYYSDDGWSMSSMYYYDSRLENLDYIESSIEIEEDDLKDMIL